MVGSIGYVDGSDAERGNAGIEAAFEEDLAGRPGLARVLTDVHQTAYDSFVTRAPEAGADLTLSIDPNLQYEAERQLDKAIASSHARTGSIVAINPYNGDILAMANYPRYDPNVPPSSDADAAARSNLGDFHSVRAGQRLQSGHAFGRFGIHQSDARFADQLRQRDASTCTAA